MIQFVRRGSGTWQIVERKRLVSLLDQTAHSVRVFAGELMTEVGHQLIKTADLEKLEIAAQAAAIMPPERVPSILGDA